MRVGTSCRFSFSSCHVACDHVLDFFPASVQIDGVGIEGPLQQHAVDCRLDDRSHCRCRHGAQLRALLSRIENARQITTTGLVGLGIEPIASLGRIPAAPEIDEGQEMVSVGLRELEVGGDVGAELLARARRRRPRAA